MSPRAELEIRLRPVESADLGAIFEQQRDPESFRMAGFTPRNQADFQTHWGKILTDPEITARIILADGETAGHVVCWFNEGFWEVGYWVERSMWGRGIASRALGDFLRIVSTRPLHAQVLASNHGSIRVLEKSGFVPGSPSARENDRRYVLNS